MLGKCRQFSIPRIALQGAIVVAVAQQRVLSPGSLARMAVHPTAPLSIVRQTGRERQSAPTGTITGWRQKWARKPAQQRDPSMSGVPDSWPSVQLHDRGQSAAI